MKGLRWGCTVSWMLIASGMLLASPLRSEKALWIELKEKDGKTTTIAVTEGIAREVLNSTETKMNFSGKGGKELITKEMVQSVLDEQQESVEARDNEDGSEAKLYLKPLDIPGKGNGDGRLVFETYKSGKMTFRLSLPEVEMECHDEKSVDFVSVSFGWKGLLPFMAKAGGAIFIEDHNDESEVWIYVE